ncbi:MAG: crossover junction endodeoxyribonuclease RuvC [Candidatus Omnitrophota bacterium]
MIILGVDPALAITGYGVIQIKGLTTALVEAGIIQTKSKESTPQRLEKIYRGVVKLISDTQAECIVLEKIYSHYKHPATACILGQARGVICLAASTQNIPFFEYAATRIKKSITGNGLASKAQVQRMVVQLLGLAAMPEYMDVTDALALAIGHSSIRKSKI